MLYVCACCTRKSEDGSDFNSASKRRTTTESQACQSTKCEFSLNGLKTRVHSEVGSLYSDLATVLGSFMIAPLWSMRRSGIHLTPFEMSSYQAAWRHVGYYLGCDPKFLNQFYGSSFALAESAFAALAFDAFPEEIPVDGYNTPTYKILLAVSERPPRAQSVEHHLQYSRRLLGTQLADQLALPRASFRHRFSVELDLWLGWSFVTFGRWWIRPGWDVDRIEWFKDVLPLLVLWNLGERRTTFAWRPEDRRDQVSHVRKQSHPPDLRVNLTTHADCTLRRTETGQRRRRRASE